METESSYTDGMILNVNHLVDKPGVISRQVTVETQNGTLGINAGKFWFPWDNFFAVNNLISIDDSKSKDHED